MKLVLIASVLLLELSIPSFAQLVTQNQFNCAAKTKGGNPSASTYQLFLKSLGPAKISSKSEAAKYLAHSCWETEGWKYTKEQLCVRDLEKCRTAYYNTGKGRAGKVYYGRGMLQLTWDYNYYDASQALFRSNNLIDNPEKVADDPTIAWSTASWFWSSKVHSSSSTFGSTLKVINSIECDGGPNSQNRILRFNHYKQVMKCLGMPAPSDQDGYCRA